MLVSLSALVVFVVVTNFGPTPGAKHLPSTSSPFDRSAHLAIRVDTNPTVEGTFASATPGFIVLDGPSGLWGVPVAKGTKFCRADKGCAATRADLRIGDQILATVLNDRALDIDVNPVATDVQIDAIFGDRLVVHDVRHPDLPDPPYTLVVQPDTILMPRVSGAPYVPQVGDRIYYTGRAASSDANSTVYALRIFP
jgi:hypothetical protein